MLKSGSKLCDVLGLWPDDRPLVILHSGGAGRWSIVAEPREWRIIDGRGGDPLRELDDVLRSTAAAKAASDLPFVGGWIGFVSYELGRMIEPAAQHRNAVDADRDWPLIAMARCPDAMVFDHERRQWHKVGDGHVLAIHPTDGNPEALGCDAYSISDLRSNITPDDYLAAVSRTLEYIAAGDIFQANIAQRFTARFDGSPRALAMRAFEHAQPRYGAYLELPSGCIISMSPELFLHVDGPTRRVTTRPIKGTAPATSDPARLKQSVKDAAELHMIVDLMRNDLGRVCEFGSVSVPCPRTIETYPTVHHGVAEVTGVLRRDVTFTDLLRATFPPGSVTGAPKIRAMQIIDELEPFRRGPYCGAIGFISDCGNVTLNVAIRTIALSGEWDGDVRRFNGTLDYGAGCGIVADSDPIAEYRESIDKVAVLREAVGEQVAQASRLHDPPVDSHRRDACATNRLP